MDCEQVRQLLDAYADGQLDADTKAQVEAHLSACGACRAEKEALEGYLAIMAEAADVKAPAGFCEDVMQRLPKSKITWLHNTRAMVTAVAACAVIAVIGAGGVQQYNEYHTTTEQQAVQSTPMPTAAEDVAATPEMAAAQNEARQAPAPEPEQAAEKFTAAPVKEFAADVPAVEENQKSNRTAMQDTASIETAADSAPATTNSFAEEIPPAPAPEPTQAAAAIPPAANSPAEASPPATANVPAEVSLPVAEAAPEAAVTESTTFGYARGGGSSGGGGSASVRARVQTVCTYTVAEADRDRAALAVAGLKTEEAVEAALNSDAIAYAKTVEYIDHTEAYAAADEAGKAEIQALCEQPEIVFLYQ